MPAPGEGARTNRLFERRQYVSCGNRLDPPLSPARAEEATGSVLISVPAGQLGQSRRESMVSRRASTNDRVSA